MKKMKDLSGAKFGMLTVIRYDHNRAKNSLWLCRCDCGNEKVILRSGFVSGGTTSCGCATSKLIGDFHRQHGLTGHPFHRAWKNIRTRCSNKKNNSYQYYGARGIKVCERWSNFDNFYQDMWPTWEAGLTIERDDVNGNYEPGNCRWITQLDQGKNKRNSAYLDSPWGRLHAAEVARKIGISPSSLCRRMKRWPPEKVFIPATKSNHNIVSQP